ncbi:MAG: XdhC family protein [Saprospiraceae bacterium]|nr:XdhC family protein [Saprospiraceae bacterium]
MRASRCVVWEQLEAVLSEGSRAMLLYVLKSEGSSPGRRGFAMCVLADGNIRGTIGGGIMEHKLVELAKAQLASRITDIILKEQHHTKDHPTDRSGMICSGSQYVALVPVAPHDLQTVHNLLTACQGEQPVRLVLGPSGLTCSEDLVTRDGLHFVSLTDWEYSEVIGVRPRVHIIGAGHVGLALSELMAGLGFYALIYDDRSQLNTLEQNVFAHEKHIVEYHQIGGVLSANEDDYVVIMTFGYRTDKLVLEQLMGRRFRYIGMMGSDQKIAQMKEDWEREGVDPQAYAHVHAPIGLPILSKTAGEIAVSIAAEIIREKNKDLPTGRTSPNL